MFGNWATGDVRTVSPPTKTRTIEITIATIGRLMKNFDIGLPDFGLRGKRLGIYVRTGAHFLNSLGNHPISAIYTAYNDPLTTDTVADRHCPDVHFIVRIYNSNLIASLEF